MDQPPGGVLTEKKPSSMSSCRSTGGKKITKCFFLMEDEYLRKCRIELEQGRLNTDNHFSLIFSILKMHFNFFFFFMFAVFQNWDTAYTDCQKQLVINWTERQL